MIGDNIREIRKLKRITQAELSGIMGIHRTYISQIEGNHRKPSIDNFIKIMKSMKCSRKDICDILEL